MTYRLTHEFAEVMSVFAEIQECARTLASDQAEVVYLFFVGGMTVTDVSYVCHYSYEQVYPVVQSFLNDLFARSERLRTLVAGISRGHGSAYSSVSMLREQDRRRLVNRICQLAAIEETGDSFEERIREIVGTALRLAGPLVESDPPAEQSPRPLPRKRSLRLA